MITDEDPLRLLLFYWDLGVSLALQFFEESNLRRSDIFSTDFPPCSGSVLATRLESRFLEMLSCLFVSTSSLATRFQTPKCLVSKKDSTIGPLA